MINYQKLLQQQSNIKQELNEIEELIYENNSNIDFNEHMLEYPHLFHNEDSLFLPDALYASKGLCRRSLENLYDDNSASKNNMIKNDKINKFKIEGSKKEEKIFAQYLDTLEINQFLQVQNQLKVKQKLKCTNSQKTLESSLECTFKPSILKKSSQMAGNLKPSFQRLTMPVRNNQSGVKKIPYRPPNEQYNKQYSKQRIQRLSKPRILKTEPSQPLEYQRPELQKKYSIQRSSNYLDVAARNQLWQEQKKLKLQRMRKQQEENRLKKQSSTFAPKLTQYRGEKGVNLSNFGKEGMVNYFQRLNMAKARNIAGKQNGNNLSAYGRKDSSPYCSNSNSNINQNNFSSKTPKKEKNGDVNSNKVTKNKKNTSGSTYTNINKNKIKYDDAVKQLHRKLMSLNI